ncbi:MAG: FAD-dependent oxidoreductase [Candidatus Eremiobacteraeota bacterium]|nr:FAD-dependent oxidoreductase [Candidatus Eremiobacteraeota bacterium]
MAHTAIVLGAGTGGIAAANEIRRRCAKNDRVLLIDRSERFLFAPSLLWLAVGERRARDIHRPVRELVRSGVEFLRGNIGSIDPASRTIALDGRGMMSADALVVALGAALAPESIPGLAQAGHNFYTLPGAESLRDALAAFPGGRILVLTASPAYKCPAAPYEAALLIDALLRKRGLRRRSEIDMYASEAAPMAVAGAPVSAAVVAMLGEKGIVYTPNRQILSADPAMKVVTFTDGSTEEYDLLAYVPPHRPPSVLATSGLVGENGWIPVDRATLQTDFASVYAIGDNATIALQMGKPLPKAGVFAYAQAKIVARNLVAEWHGKPVLAMFDGHGACFVETGGMKAAMGSGNFFAEPTPAIALRPPSLWLHLAKVLVERRGLGQWPF